MTRASRRWLAAQYYSDNRCHYCRVLTHRFEGPHMATVDHKEPASGRGWDHPTNYVLACYQCNQAKGCTPYAEFIAIVDTRRMAERRGDQHDSR